MNYKDVILELLNKFPCIKKCDDYDDLLDLPHCFFDMIFWPYVKQLCREEAEEELLEVGGFLERMEEFGDSKVRELVNVSFLEPAVLDEEYELINYLENYLYCNTLKDLRYWKERYNKS